MLSHALLVSHRHAHAALRCLPQVRIQRLYQLADDSQDSLQMPHGGAAAEVMVQYERYSRTATTAGFVYRPSVEAGACRATRLRPFDAETLPREIVVEEDGGGVADGTPGACTGGADRGGGGGQTPDGSDGPTLMSGSTASGDSSSSEADSCAQQAGAVAAPGSTQPSQQPRPPQQQQPQQQAGVGGADGPADGPLLCDLFCGFGGLTLGLLRALLGSRVGWACDNFEAALKTYAGCHPGGAKLQHQQQSCVNMQTRRREGW